MSHELAQNADGKFMYAFKGARSAIWHDAETQGANVADDASTDELLDAAGFDFDYVRAAVRYPTRAEDANNPAAWQVMQDKHVLIPSTTNRGVSIVSDKFEIAQPAAMRQLARLVAQTIDGSADSAGVVFDSAGMFINIRAGEAITVMGQDILLPHFLIATMNDGSMPTCGKASTTRTVCNNTMQVALGSKKHVRDFRLSHRSEFDPVQVAAYWSAALALQKAQVEKFKLLADTPVKHAQADQIVFDLFNGKRADDKKQSADAIVSDGKRDIRNSAGYKTVIGLFNGAGMGSMMNGARGTAWGLLNSVTEFVDHHVTAKSSSHRWESANFGSGAQLKDAAFKSIMLLADGTEIEA